MNWTDLVVLVLIGGMVAGEAKRGLGKALLTAIGAFFAMRLALAWCVPLARAVALTRDAGSSRGAWMLILFGLLVAAAVLLTHAARPETWLSLDPFEGLLGGALGLVTGWIVAIVFLRMVSAGGGADVVRHSAFAPEVLELRTYHRVVNGLYGLGEVPFH